MNNSYWEIAMGEILSDAGIDYTSEQLKEIADSVEGAAEVQGEYSSPAYYPVYDELEETRAALKKEQSKVFCQVCKGTGRESYPITSSHWADTQCYKCNGNGKHA